MKMFDTDEFIELVKYKPCTYEEKNQRTCVRKHLENHGLFRMKG